MYLLKKCLKFLSRTPSPKTPKENPQEDLDQLSLNAKISQNPNQSRTSFSSINATFEIPPDGAINQQYFNYLNDFKSDASIEEQNYLFQQIDSQNQQLTSFENLSKTNQKFYLLNDIRQKAQFQSENQQLLYQNEDLKTQLHQQQIQINNLVEQQEIQNKYFLNFQDQNFYLELQRPNQPWNNLLEEEINNIWQQIKTQFNFIDNPNQGFIQLAYDLLQQDYQQKNLHSSLESYYNILKNPENNQEFVDDNEIKCLFIILKIFEKKNLLPTILQQYFNLLKEQNPNLEAKSEIDQSDFTFNNSRNQIQDPQNQSSNPFAFIKFPTQAKTNSQEEISQIQIPNTQNHKKNKSHGDKLEFMNQNPDQNLDSEDLNQTI